jgi:2-oxoglutarate ferredoxin oxidoreductase subunit gamma
VPEIGTQDVVRVRLTGRGGQGIMLAGAILAQAATYDERYVVETQEYGPEARLGATKAELVIASRPIAYPLVDAPDILLCLSRDGFLRYGRQIVPGGVRLVDATLRDEMGDLDSLVYLPFRQTARLVGSELFTNIVALGATAALTGVVGEASLARAVAERVKPEYREDNARALSAGYRLAASDA